MSLSNYGAFLPAWRVALSSEAEEVVSSMNIPHTRVAWGKRSPLGQRMTQVYRLHVHQLGTCRKNWRKKESKRRISNVPSNSSTKTPRQQCSFSNKFLKCVRSLPLSLPNAAQIRECSRRRVGACQQRTLSGHVLRAPFSGIQTVSAKVCPDSASRTRC